LLRLFAQAFCSSLLLRLSVKIAGENLVTGEGWLSTVNMLGFMALLSDFLLGANGVL